MSPSLPGAARFNDIDKAIKGVDVVMALRIQKERMNDAHIPDDAAYCREYGLTAERIKLAKPDAIYMHPLPADRNIEVTDGVMDGPQSVVYDQAENRLHAQKAVMALTMG